jgi:UDP-N-acetylglucosamine--N-acetylmuramyl-(pentapeptide) pyrophosphoryl-undecaprenol N-acetylglucosamine transferase
VQTLFVSSDGGHFDELWELKTRLPDIRGEITWVTFDTPQIRVRLENEQRVFIPPAQPRDVRAFYHHTRMAHNLLRTGNWSALVSTGCLPAVPFFAQARLRGIPCHFFESATRIHEPSLTGAVIERIPGVQRYSQYPWLDRPKWQSGGSVFDAYRSEHRERRAIKRVVVMVGTSQFDFRRMLKSAAGALPRDAEVLWQTGASNGEGLPGVPRKFVPEDELHTAMSRADVVICHAGVGSILAAFRAGRFPIIVPRRRSLGEHVDDHQIALTKEVVRRGLGLAAEPNELTPEIMAEAAARSVARLETPPPIYLAGGEAAPPIPIEYLESA